MNAYTVTIKEVFNATPKVRVIRVENPLEHEFASGQFFMVSLPDHPTVKVGRAYSAASSPKNKEYIEFAFDKIGLLTTELFKCEVGDSITLKGPYGKFAFDEQEETDILLIGSGTGITPLISIIRCCEDKNITRSIKLLYSVKEKEEIIYQKELKQPKLERYAHTVCVTRDDSYTGRKERIDKELINQNLPNPTTTTCFLCGSKEFVHQMITWLEKLGVAKDQIKTDVW